MALLGVERDKSLNRTKQLEDVQYFTCKMECWFFHKWRTWEIKKITSSKWRQVTFPLWVLEVKEVAIEEYVELAREEIVGAKYNMAELMNLA